MKIIKKIIEYGLYLLVFLLPWQTRWIIRAGEINEGYSEYLTISLYGIDILLFIVILLYGYIVIKDLIFKNVDLRINYAWWWIVGMELFIFISIFFASDKVLALYRYGILLLGIGLFWLIINVNYNKSKLIGSFLAGIFLQACLGIWQFLTQSDFACKWLGIAMHDQVELGVSVIETIGSDGIGQRWLRAYGGMDHPNVLGGLLVVGVLLAVGLLIKYKGFKNKKFGIWNLEFGSNNIQYLLFALYFLFLTSLFFTFSRGAWAGLIIGAVMMLFFTIIKKDWSGQKEILKIILFSSILIFILVGQFSALVKVRLSNNARLEIKSNIERVESLTTARKLVKENWLFGAGIGNYTLALNQLKPDQPSWYYQPVHNVFLLIWAEIGLLGLLGFLGFLGWLGFKNKRYAGLSILLALVIIMLVDHWLWSLHFGILFFWLLAGLMLADDK